MNDDDVLQDRYIHIPPDTDNDDELLIITGAYLNECSQAPAKVQPKSPECRKLTAKRPCTKKAPKVEEKTQWVESDDEVTDSEDERWQQNFCKKVAEYKARKADIGESESDAEVGTARVGTARVVRKRKSPSDSDEDLVRKRLTICPTSSWTPRTMFQHGSQRRQRLQSLQRTLRRAKRI